MSTAESSKSFNPTNISKLKHIKKIANTSISGGFSYQTLFCLHFFLESQSQQQNHTSYENLKINPQSLNKYHRIFNDSGLVQGTESSMTHIPKNLMNRTLPIDPSFSTKNFRNLKKKGPLTSLLHNPLEKSSMIETNDLTDNEIKRKSELTRIILEEDRQKKKEKIKTINDVSFLKEEKTFNRTSMKETSILKDGLDVIFLT